MDAETLQQLMSARRSVRRFEPEVPERALVERLIRAAVSAPSASNKQAWRFLAVTDRALIDRAAAAVRSAVEEVGEHVKVPWRAGYTDYAGNFTRFEDAPLVIVALCRPLSLLSQMTSPELSPERRQEIVGMERSSGLIGASMALMNLLLMAHAEGLGATPMTGALVAGGALRELFEVRGEWELVALVPIGYPNETPQTTPRKPIARVLRWIEGNGGS